MSIELALAQLSDIVLCDIFFVGGELPNEFLKKIGIQMHSQVV